MRFLKNIKNGRVFPWTEALAKRDFCVDCDKNGNLMLENVSISDEEMTKALEQKASECNVLRKQVATLIAENNKYHDLYGALDYALPQKNKTADDIVATAEAVAAKSEPKKEDTEPEQPELTNKELKAIVAEKGLEMPRNASKANLKTVIAESEKK